MKPGRNDPCPCGSGRKYKKCCLERDREQARGEDAGRAAGVEKSPVDAPTPRPADIGTLFAMRKELDLADTMTAQRMEAIVEEVMRRPEEVFYWDALLANLERLGHPDMPGVVRRLLEIVPSRAEFGNAGLYAAIGDFFARHGQRDELAVLASRYLELDIRELEPLELPRFLDLLLMEGFEAEALGLAEHFRALANESEVATNGSKPGVGRLFLELRVARCLRQRPASSLERLVVELSQDLAGTVPEALARGAAAAIGEAHQRELSRQAFDLPQPARGSEELDLGVWLSDADLFASFTRLAREAWQSDEYSPECVLRGLDLMCSAAYDWVTRNPERTATRYPNLLDYLRPAGLDERLERMIEGYEGADRYADELLLLAHEVLLALAERQGFMSPDDAAESSRAIQLSKLLVNPWRHAAVFAD